MLDTKTNYKDGFQRGYNQLLVKDVKAAREELWEVLGCRFRSGFQAYKSGKVEPKASQAAAVEAVFRKYGITDIWGK